ncbi:MFS transporter [Rhodoferax mekongensis]|uniref:MFS transporter n=1 Tax=Rhodoferax mekongensis TaxID=3068341 RepID=UPI0028BD3F82|nr:MFS transporter [Rhodoferax sp. TBRC 17199]MDT7515252.1 MFS transporter [Rhodoferax sp. TBRC 17199]
MSGLHAPAHSAASTPQSPWALLRLISGHVCLHASMAGMRLAAPLWALQQGYGPFAVGFLLALFSLSQVFLALPAGRFADRHGLRKPVSWAVVASIAGATAAALYPHFAVLCFAALMMGGATGSAAIALQRHVGRAAADATDLRRVFSWLSIGPAISNFLGPVCAGLLIDHAGVWLGGKVADHNGFVAAFALTALLPSLAWMCVRTTRELDPVVHAGGVPPSAWPLFKEPMMRRLLLVNWLLSSCWDVHTFVVPVLGHERGYSASVIGTILGAFAVAAAVVRVFLPLLASRLREWAVVTTAMVVTALLFAVYPLMPSAWAMGVCSVLLGLTLGTVQPMIMSTLHQITPHALHGQAIALRLMTINLSSVLMPMLFGTAGVVVGVSVVFWTVGALVGLGSHAAWRLRSEDYLSPGRPKAN